MSKFNILITLTKNKSLSVGKYSLINMSWAHLFHNFRRWPGLFLSHDIMTRFISLKQVKSKPENGCNYRQCCSIKWFPRKRGWRRWKYFCLRRFNCNVRMLNLWLLFTALSVKFIVINHKNLSIKTYPCAYILLKFSLAVYKQSTARRYFSKTLKVKVTLKIA